MVKHNFKHSRAKPDWLNVLFKHESLYSDTMSGPFAMSPKSPTAEVNKLQSHKIITLTTRVVKR